MTEGATVYSKTVSFKRNNTRYIIVDNLCQLILAALKGHKEKVLEKLLKLRHVLYICF